MSKEVVAGKCGIYCGACDIFFATHHPQFRSKLAKHLGCEEEELSCQGCGGLTSKCWGDGCRFINCCETHQVEHCEECPRFPCASLVEFNDSEVPHHHFIIENLYRRKEIGVQQWLLEQKERWSCKNCGHPFRWYGTTCAYCGEPIHNIEDEDSERIIIE